MGGAQRYPTIRFVRKAMKFNTKDTKITKVRKETLDLSW
jgi:hypothetical protein